MTDQPSAKPLFVLALIGLLGTIVTLSVLLGETKAVAFSKPAATEPAPWHR